jgi:pyruvate/2-oxoglutarate dehydrogenase complex dihydrolipoamide acyltransferase (E2) component
MTTVPSRATGHIAERPVAREGTVVIAPIMRLCLTFDHRVVDGAEAADVLADLKAALEGFAAHREPAGTVPQAIYPTTVEG